LDGTKAGDLALGADGDQVATQAIALAELLMVRLPAIRHMVQPVTGEVSRFGRCGGVDRHDADRHQ